jgi:hypothetical protein
MGKDWRDITYLQGGTERQRSAYGSLRESRMLEILGGYDPVLVSTVCVDVDIPSSDLDLICEAQDLEEFSTFLSSTFGNFRGFFLHRSDRSPPALVAQFFHGSWEYEIFGQNLPVERQAAFRHLVQIERVLGLGGPAWREAIRTLKLCGLKTEPALARCLGMEGDPYEGVLLLERLSDEELSADVWRMSSMLPKHR